MFVRPAAATQHARIADAEHLGQPQCLRRGRGRRGRSGALVLGRARLGVGPGAGDPESFHCLDGLIADRLDHRKSRPVRRPGVEPHGLSLGVVEDRTLAAPAPGLRAVTAERQAQNEAPPHQRLPIVGGSSGFAGGAGGRGVGVANQVDAHQRRRGQGRGGGRWRIGRHGGRGRFGRLGFWGGPEQQGAGDDADQGDGQDGGRQQLAPPGARFGSIFRHGRP